MQTKPENVELQEREKPSPAEDEVRVRVHSAGLCGSDVHAYTYEEGYEWITMSRIIGHEYAGTVDQVGEDVIRYEAGDKVIEEPIHHCGACYQCGNGQPNVCRNVSITGKDNDGGCADYIAVKARHLHAVPEDVPL